MAKPIKPKLITNIYEKKFESFTEMISEFKTMHPEMTEIFPYDDEEVKPKNAADDVLKYFTDNAPDVVEGVNLPLSLSMSSSRVLLKTAKFFSVGWIFKFDKNGFVTDLTAKIYTFSRENEKNPALLSLMETLENRETGWYEVPQGK